MILSMVTTAGEAIFAPTSQLWKRLHFCTPKFCTAPMLGTFLTVVRKHEKHTHKCSSLQTAQLVCELEANLLILNPYEKEMNEMNAICHKIIPLELQRLATSHGHRVRCIQDKHTPHQKSQILDRCQRRLPRHTRNGCFWADFPGVCFTSYNRSDLCDNHIQIIQWQKP